MGRGHLPSRPEGLGEQIVGILVSFPGPRPKTGFGAFGARVF